MEREERELLEAGIDKLKALREEYALLQERMMDATTKMEVVLEELEALLE